MEIWRRAAGVQVWRRGGTELGVFLRWVRLVWEELALELAEKDWSTITVGAQRARYHCEGLRYSTYACFPVKSYAS